MENQSKQSFKETLSALLRSNRRHVRYVQALVVLAILVAVVVPLAMRQSGVAMATTETRLNCQYNGNGAHTHNEDCYDADGNLVCPLVERPFHTHTADCYATETVLACGQAETEGHAHGEGCYDEEGNLTCTLEETLGHKHTDACYETRTTDQLVCGLEETAEEHVHGPACFEKVTVNVPDPAAPAATTEAAPAEDPNPEQEFTGSLKVKDEDGNERVVLIAQVKAPQGALPNGSTMRVEHVDLSKKDEFGVTAQDKLDEALRKEAGEKAAFVQEDAVDIAFYDADGKRVDPAKKVEVRITTAMIRTFSDQRTAKDEAVADNSILVMHVVDKQHTKRTNAPDAEVLRNIGLVNQNKDDHSTGHEDTVLFETDEFSPFVVARVNNAALAPEAEADVQPSEDKEEATTEGASDEKADETAEPVETAKTPALTFSHRFSNSDGQSLLTVNVFAPAGAFPVGTTMQVTWVNASQVERAVSQAVAERTDGRLVDLRAVDITFIDPDGKEIEPAEKITVTFVSDLIDTADDSYVVHLDDKGKAEVVDALGADELKSREIADQADELVIESDQFSTYVVAVTTLQKQLTASDGATYDITVDAPAEAGIPQDAELQVSEIARGTAGYQDYLSQALQALGEDAADGATSARFFDIKIMLGDEEIQPQAPVRVSIQLADAADAGTTASAVHFRHSSEETPEVLDATQDGDVTSFDADGFSVYGVIYTVDFHYDVDGQTYDFSIQGGDTLSLRELLVALNVVPAEEAEDFMSQVSDVRFSDPELIAVAKVDEDTTAGELKAALNLEPEYSSELTEDDIAAMDAKELTTPDWALMTLKAFDTEETLTVVMANGDIFTIKVTDARDPLGLDGRTFAIVTQRQENNGNLGNWHSLQASVQDHLSNRGYYMDALRVDRYLDESTNTEYCDAGATAWKFEYFYSEDEETGEATSGYYVSAGGKYLYIDPTKATKDDTNTGDNPNPHSLNLVDSKQEGTLLKITRNDDGTYCIANFKDLKLWNYNNSYWLANDDTAIRNSHVHLCLPEAHGANDPHKATLISAADVQDGQKVVIYQRVVQSSDGTIKYYALDGNGLLVEVSPSSDAIYWRGNKAIEWTVQSSGSYVTLYNEQTGTYLTPNGDGFVVHTLEDYDGDTDKLSVTLPGRDRGTYTSKISCWDYAERNTYGPNVQATTSQTGEITTVALQSVLFEDSQSFYFAARDPIVHDQLTTVATVDSVSKGIKITMYDWGDERGADAHREHWDGNNPNVQAYLSDPQRNIMGDSSHSYVSGAVKTDIVSRTLETTGNNKGYPTINTNNGRSLHDLFNEQYIRTGTTAGKVNNLFLQSVYDETGYFKYSCFENYAYLPTGSNDFIVYEQIGTPSTRNSLTSDHNFARGNFMPYNELNEEMNYRQNLYDPDLQALDPSDPRYNERLYYIENQPAPSGMTNSPNPEAYANYFFGMKMEATFTQNPGGISDNGDPMVYEFNGDDDLWVYLDGVRVLDLGGVHDAFHGTIDFRTGVVHVNAKDASSSQAIPDTWIGEEFKKAGKLPDGTTWDNNTPEETILKFFNKDANGHWTSFTDYSIHDFTMFYMERGASASNLEMKFNLPTLPETAFRVGKEMPETQSGNVIQDEYADAFFYYEAYHEVDGQWVKYTQQDFTGDKTAYYSNEFDGNGAKVPVVWKSGDSNETKFEVKPGQIAVFPVTDGAYNTKWKVCEVEPEAQSVMLNNFEIHNTSEDSTQPTSPEGKTWTSYPWSTAATIRERNQVIYTNKPDDALVNELRITKHLNGEMIKIDPSGPDDESNYIKAADGSAFFEYKIFMETTEGKLLPYAPGQDRETGAYYLIDAEGKYIYYVGGQRRQATYDETTGKYYYDGELLDEPRITGYASANGSIGDIRDGDTVVIKGLHEGTEFIVYERIDRSIMARGAESDGRHYVFEDAVIEIGSAYNRDTGEGLPDYPTGSLFDDPDESGVWYTVTEGEGAYYERDHKAQGAIIQNQNAQVDVRNRSAIPADVDIIKVAKDNTELTLAGAQFHLLCGHDLVTTLQITALSGGGEIEVDSTTGVFTVPKGGVHIANLEPGTYTLVEDLAPNGYIIDVGSFSFTVNQDGTLTSDYLAADGLALTIPNPPGAELPEAGGPGTYLYTLCGLALFAAAGYIGFVSRRSSRKEVV